MPFFLWLRYLTVQKLAEIHRQHLGTKARDASRDVSIDGGESPEAASHVLAETLVGRLSNPSSNMVRAEMKQRLQQALDQLPPLDREVIALRHFERLTYDETAQVMGMTTSGATSRYLRAMKKLKDQLTQFPEFEDEAF